jgi:hypothetical protein
VLHLPSFVRRHSAVQDEDRLPRRGNCAFEATQRVSILSEEDERLPDPAEEAQQTSDLALAARSVGGCLRNRRQPTPLAASILHSGYRQHL